MLGNTVQHVHVRIMCIIIVTCANGVLAHTWLSVRAGMIKCLVLEQSQENSTEWPKGFFRGMVTCPVLDRVL